MKYRSVVSRRGEEQGRRVVTFLDAVAWPGGSALAWQQNLPMGTPSCCIQFVRCQHGDIPGPPPQGVSITSPGCHLPFENGGRENLGMHLPQQGCALLRLILEEDLKILE